MQELLDLLAKRTAPDRWGVGTPTLYLAELQASADETVAKAVQDSIQQAADKLTYCSPDLVVRQAKKTAIPNSILEFDHVITTTRKDRDGDILESGGATLDYKMPLLWQHMSAQPIGRLARITEHTDSLIAGKSVILDTALGRDAAVLVEGGALRISHGFRPQKWEILKDGKGNTTGVHISEFEIMEVSLVSVPANEDAVITAFSREKLASPLVKAWAGKLFENRKTVVSVPAGVGVITKGSGAEMSATATATDTNTTITPPANPPAAPATKATGDDLLKSYNDANKNIRVVKASERYDDTRLTGRHKRTGETVDYMGVPITLPSKKDLAFAGAWWKHWLRCSSLKVGAALPWSVPTVTDHDKQLLEELIHTQPFAGKRFNEKWENGAYLTDMDLDPKAVLNDATSGGENITPFVLETMAWHYPLLHSEILPFVTTRETNADSVKVPRFGTVTVSWGTAEGTAISLFDTDAWITAKDINIHPLACAVEWGKDLANDSPLAVGSHLQQSIGNSVLKELDNVIVSGSGSRPEGITVASGTTTVNADSAGGAPTVGDYLKLMFGLGKEYRERPGARPCYITTDTSYKRVRSIATGVTGDDRLLFGMNVGSYETFDYRHAVNGSISNAKLLFVDLAAYLLYRRTGLEFAIITQDWTLARQNKVGLVARCRYGGALIDGAAAAIMSDSQA